MWRRRCFSLRPEDQGARSSCSISAWVRGRMAMPVNANPASSARRADGLLCRIVALDGREQVVEIEWLGEESGGADLLRPQARVLGRRHHEDRHRDAALAQLLREFPT